jgi:hypothetical protein
MNFWLTCGHVLLITSYNPSGIFASFLFSATLLCAVLKRKFGGCLLVG